MIEVKINGTPTKFDGDPTMPLLWFLREEAQLKGAKYACGIAVCGACTVLLNGVAVRSCTLPMSAVAGGDLLTIEGLATGDKLHPVQEAWLEEDVAQCGYCQSGQILSVVELLRRIPHPTDEQIDANLTNICRCGTYNQLRKAVHRAAKRLDS